MLTPTSSPSVLLARNPTHEEGWFVLPTFKKLKLYLVLTLFLTFLFCTLYGFSNWYAAQGRLLYHFYFDWELDIPFVPQMVYVYLSLNGLLTLTLFLLNERQLICFARAFSGATVIASLVFLIFPTQSGFVRQMNIPGYESILGGLYTIDYPYNNFPSLHITYSSLTVLAVYNRVPLWFRCFLGTWLICICASVLLVHQHHLADIGGGVLLAILCRRIWLGSSLEV